MEVESLYSSIQKEEVQHLRELLQQKESQIQELILKIAQLEKEALSNESREG